MFSRNQLRQRLLVLLLQLLLVGCSTMFSQVPLDFYDGPKRENSNVALIRGQAYMVSVGNWVEVHIKEVDGKVVYNEITSLVPPYIVNVAPGSHELSIVGLLGNSARYYKHDNQNLPKVSGNFEAGKAYQILFDVISEEGKPKSANYPDHQEYSAIYHVHQIGTIAEYNEFLIKNPNHKLGYPIPKLIKQ
jgi:hypothetical protein